MLIQCDASIKAIISQLDERRHDIIIEDIDDETLVVKENKLPELKARLAEKLKDTVREVSDSDSDGA